MSYTVTDPKWNIDFNTLQFSERIGKGNFGEVWKGKYLGTDVAIKRLYFSGDNFMQKYFAREINTLGGLSHPNTVQMMGISVNLGDIYIVTEFVSGGSLRQLLKNPSVSLSWSKRIMFARDIALAMTYLHHKDIMHRDLKSANMLVCPGWRLKICDFGLARKKPGEEDVTITTVGTCEWMAPEVLMQAAYDNSADVFSYGMVLYEIMTRSKPPKRSAKQRFEFDFGDPDVTIPRNAGAPDDTPREMWELMLRCVATDPDARPTWSGILASLAAITVDDHQYESDEDIDGEAPIPAPKQPSQRRRRAPTQQYDSNNNEQGEPEKAGDDEEFEEDDEMSEEETSSYLSRGKEITEVTKIIKKPFRKQQFCRFECSIDKNSEWLPNSEVPVNIRIENQTGKTVKTIKIWLQITKSVGNKHKFVKHDIVTFKGHPTDHNSGNGSFPVKQNSIWESTLSYSLPSAEFLEKAGRGHQGTSFDLRFEFALAGGLSKKAQAVLPITFIASS